MELFTQIISRMMSIAVLNSDKEEKEVYVISVHPETMDLVVKNDVRVFASLPYKLNLETAYVERSPHEEIGTVRFTGEGSSFIGSIDVQLIGEEE